ncbi:MAG: tyrosine--tRNA ligase [Candidatus Shikimatogenerans sp. JK-2022]|nr:tyrosine--tRNA ligase [Candidatus Shikimatogenerans bostrichidophilus]
MKKILKKFKYRKLLENYTNNINLFLNDKQNFFYIGFDPTYYTLHIGHLLAISLINRLYKLGYKNNIIIIGGATTFISNKLNYKKIKYNINQLKRQIYKLIINKKTIIINNFKWFKKKKFLNFIKNIFSKISINSFLKTKLIKNKISQNKQIDFTAFIYHLLQAYDYLYLNKKFKCSLQIGGSDQWYNILSGIKLIYKIRNISVSGLTYPLLLNKKGLKFSKSKKYINNIWLNTKKTSSYEFYQFFINLSDQEAIKYLKLFTFLNIKKIKQLILKHLKNKKSKIIHKYLIKFFFLWIYNKNTYKEIIKVMYILYKKKKYKYLKKNILLLKKTLKNIKVNINFNIYNKFTIYNLINFNKNIFKSYNEYNKFKNNNGILLINNKIIKNDILFINKNDLILNKYIIIKKGKKNFYLLNFNNNE